MLDNDDVAMSEEDHEEPSCGFASLRAEDVVKADWSDQYAVALLFGYRLRKMNTVYADWLSKRWHFSVLCIGAIGVFVVGLIVVGLLFIVDRTIGAKAAPDLWPLFFISQWLLVLLMLLCSRWPKRQFARYILQHDGRVCYDCGYLLSGLPDEHTCPECGKPYTVQQLRHRWMDWMQNRD